MAKPSAKFKSLTLLVLAEIAAMAVWFSSSAVIADMQSERAISTLASALMSSGVQAGFAIGALVYAMLGLADRYDPRRVFALSAFAAAACNAILLVAPIGGIGAIAARFLTGAFLAGVYPVGMKIAVGWGDKDRGLLVGILVGALTIGSAAPHLLSFFGGADWRSAVRGASIIAALGGALVLFVSLGPAHASAPRFSPRALTRAWTDQRLRLAYAGYLGHMWELYAMWAWIAVGLTAAFSLSMEADSALSAAKLTAFIAIAVGALSCVGAGELADRIGKAKVAAAAMVMSASMGVAAALAFSGPPALLIVIVIFWGASVIADSAQFSALVADFTPAEHTGALLTFQTALGFALTTITVQAAPFVANMIGWPGLFLVLAIGPVVGTLAMIRLQKITK